MVVISSASPVFAQTEAPPAGEAAPPPEAIEAPAPDPVPAPEPAADPVPEPPPPPPTRVRVYEPPPRLEVPPPTPIAPNTYRHDGFYFRSVANTLQYVWAKAESDDDTKSFDGAGAGGLLAIGGTPVEGLVIGGAIAGFGRSSHWSGISDEGDDVDLTFAQIGLLVDWFPNARGGWHVGGIVGLGFSVLTDDDDEQYTGVSGSVSLLGGYDWWIGPQWALGLVGLASFTPQADLQDDDRDDIGVSLGGATIGFGASLLHH
jgi:hypothetical protein